ncbi:MAG: hypothetical protein Q9190_002636 [Brigantiaea leucoxantha]
MLYPIINVAARPPVAIEFRDQPKDDSLTLSSDLGDDRILNNRDYVAGGQQIWALRSNTDGSYDGNEGAEHKELHVSDQGRRGISTKQIMHRQPGAKLILSSPDSEAATKREVQAHTSANELSFPRIYVIPESHPPVWLALNHVGARLPDVSTSIALHFFELRVAQLLEKHGDAIIDTHSGMKLEHNGAILTVMQLPDRHFPVRYSTVSESLRGIVNLIRQYGLYELVMTIHEHTYRPYGGDGLIYFLVEPPIVLPNVTTSDGKDALEGMAVHKRAASTTINDDVINKDNLTTSPDPLQYPTVFLVLNTVPQVWLKPLRYPQQINPTMFRHAVSMLEIEITKDMRTHGDPAILRGGVHIVVNGVLIVVEPLQGSRFPIRLHTVLDILKGVKQLLPRYGYYEMMAAIYLFGVRSQGTGDGRVKVVVPYFLNDTGAGTGITE